MTSCSVTTTPAWMTVAPAENGEGRESGGDFFHGD